jgi:hypothetical protein
MSESWLVRGVVAGLLLKVEVPASPVFGNFDFQLTISGRCTRRAVPLSSRVPGLGRVIRPSNPSFSTPKNSPNDLQTPPRWLVPPSLPTLQLCIAKMPSGWETGLIFDSRRRFREGF